MTRPYLVAMLVLVSATAPAQPLEPGPPTESQQNTSLWISPAMHVSTFALGVATKFLHVAVPLGVSRRLSERTAGVLAVTPMLTREACWQETQRCATVRQLKVTLGLTWTPWPRRNGGGLFIQPRLSGTWSYDMQNFRLRDRSSPLTYSREHGGQATLGFDVGFRTATRTGFFLEPMLGLGVGYSVNQRRNGFDPLGQYGMPVGNRLADRAILDLDLDFLRLGIAF